MRKPNIKSRTIHKIGRYIKRSFSMLLAAMLAASIIPYGCLPVFAASTGEIHYSWNAANEGIKIDGANYRYTYELEVWHYSGGYWVIGNGPTDKVKVYDNEVRDKGLLESYLIANRSDSFTFTLPGSVMTALATGNVAYKFVKNGIEPTDLFAGLTSGNVSTDLGANTMTVTLHPKFKFSETTLYDLVGSGAPEINMVNYDRGFMIYSIYTTGGSHITGEGMGMFIENNPAQYMKKWGYNTLHHGMINADGTLQEYSGHDQIYVGGADYSVSNVRIGAGSGVFTGGGAIGAHFEFPIEIEFYAVPDPAHNPTYTVRWENDDHSLLELDTGLFAGMMPSFDGSTPVSATDPSATFTGWDPAPVPVTGDATYIAQYTTRVPGKYYVSYEVTGNGAANPNVASRIPENQWVDPGTEITPAKIPDVVVSEEETIVVSEWSPVSKVIDSDTIFRATATSEVEAMSAEIDPRLLLPAYTYTKHHVIATDSSWFTFTKGTETLLYAADGAIQKGLASDNTDPDPRANPIPYTKSKIDRTHYDYSFDNPGWITPDNLGYVTIKLSARAAGSKAYDYKTIEVRPTPWIEDTLGGKQKVNRKQILSLAIAQQPTAPVTLVTINMRDTLSGEEINVTWHSDGIQDLPENTDHIKYRTLIDKPSTEYFRNLELDFLSKWDEDREWNYTVYAKDVLGNSHTVNKTLTVVHDDAPVAAVTIDPQYIREEGENFAKTYPVDSSTTEDGGDQLERTWYYAPLGEPFALMEDYTDLSFGQKQNIRFDKTGVGQFDVKVHVKEVWVDETLEEYITESDYKTAEATASSEVINIAPVVSLSLTHLKKVDLLLLSNSESELETAKTNSAAIKKKLLEEGYSANVIIEDISDAAASSGNFIYRGMLEDPEYGFNNDPFSESRYVTADDKYIFKIDSSWVETTPGDYYSKTAAAPFILNVYDRKTLAPIWSYTIPISDNETLQNASLAHDYSNKYIYLTYSGQTLIWDKETGMLIATLPFAVGYDNVMNEDFIYSFKADGIYRIDKSAMTSSRWVKENILVKDGNGSSEHGVVKVGGKYMFVCQRNMNYYRVTFDPISESFEYTYLGDRTTWTAVNTVQLYGIDAEGQVALGVRYTAALSNNPDTRMSFMLYDRHGTLVSAWAPNAVMDGYGAVRDIDGKICGFTAERNQEYHDEYGLTVYYYDIATTAEKTATKACSEMDGRFGILFGFKKPDGTVLIYLAGNQLFTAIGAQTAAGYMASFAPGSASGTLNTPQTYGAGFSAIQEHLYGTRTKMILTYAYNLVAGGNRKTYVVDISRSKADMIAAFEREDFSYDAKHSITREVGPSFDLDTFTADVLTEINAGEKSLVITGASSAAYAEKVYTMEPDTTYYYEYDTDAGADILDIYAYLNDTGGATTGYEVIDVQREDFNGPAMNPFFSFSTSNGGTGRNNGEWNVYTNEAGGGSINIPADITFTIPDGCYGLYSYNYYNRAYRSGSGSRTWEHWLSNDGGANFSYIKDEVFDSGGYLYSKRLLGPGTYVARTYFRQYCQPATNQKSYLVFNLDNVEVVLLRPTASYSAGGKSLLSKTANTSTLGDITHVSGRFNTPNRVLSYGSFLQNYSGHYAEVFASPLVGRTERTFTLDETSFIPYIRMNVQGWGRWRDVGSSGSYTRAIASLHGTGTYNDYYETTIYNYSASWYMSPAPWSDTTGWNNLGNNVASDVIYCGATDNKITIQGSYGYNNNESRFNSMEYFYIPSSQPVPASLTNNRFFYEGGNLFYEDNTYTGRTYLDFKTGEGLKTVNNLKIYKIDNGRKVYVVNDSMHKDSQSEGWSAYAGSAVIAPVAKIEIELPINEYDKGETVGYDFNYYDYENDPSKASYFRYTHLEAWNDGVHQKSGQTLTEPIEQFWHDGKYRLEHWQWDNTGNVNYDLQSNIAVVTFIIRPATIPTPDPEDPIPGGGTPTPPPQPANRPPTVELVTTDPDLVEAGDAWDAVIEVDDEDKDVLTVRIEIYSTEDPGSPIYTKTLTGVTPDGSGKYPAIIVHVPDAAKEETYTISVRDHDGQYYGYGSHSFTCEIVKSLTALVLHTDAEELRRNSYNATWNGSTTNDTIGEAGWDAGGGSAADNTTGFVSGYGGFAAAGEPRIRYQNVFWPGEQLVLYALVGGAPNSVTASMLEVPGVDPAVYTGIEVSLYTATLSENYEVDGKYRWDGIMWDAAMQDMFTKAYPVPVIIRFTAAYNDSTVLNYDVPIIFDQDVILYNFRITSITDPGMDNVLPAYVKDLAYDENNTGNASLMKRGYKFYFALNSLGLSGENDYIRITPVYFGYNEGTDRYDIPLDVYYEEGGIYRKGDQFALFDDSGLSLGSLYEMMIPASLRTSEGAAQLWRGALGLPQKTLFVKKSQAVSQETMYDGKVLVRFGINGMRETTSMYSYIGNGQWHKERVNGSGYLLDPAKNIYSDGDVIVINGSTSARDDYRALPVWRKQ